MKKFRSVIAAAMAATMVLTMTACDEEVTPSGGNSGTPSGSNPGQSSSSSSTSLVSAREEFSDSNVQEAVGKITDKLEDPDMKVEKRIKWLAWYNIEESTPAGELFKAAYGIPETGDNPDAAGQIFEWENVAYVDRYTKLATNIQADLSPDLFPFEGTDFPIGVVMNRYQPIDDLLDLTQEKWAGAKDLMDQYVVNGRYYCAFWDVTLGSLMWYKKSAIAEIDAEDPQELFKQGKWDWDAFLDIGRKWQQSGTEDAPRYLYDGWGVETNFMLSTGVPLISLTGGKMTSNLRDSNIERAVTFIETLDAENLPYPRAEQGWTISPRSWINNQNLFFCEGVWRYEGNGWNGKSETDEDKKMMQNADGLKDYRIRYNWPADEIRVVPFPKDPKADKHYVQLKQDSLMWVKGSTNRNGVKAWIDCSATAALDPETTEAAKQQMIDNPTKQWTRELLDFLYPLYKLDGSSPVTPVAEFRTGIPYPVYDSNASESPVASLTDFIYIDESFTTLRDTHESTIQAALDDLNKQLGAA